MKKSYRLTVPSGGTTRVFYDEAVSGRYSPEDAAIDRMYIKAIAESIDRAFVNACPKCGKELKPGDWPWCQGKPEQHKDPHYGWHFAQKD